MIVDKKNGLAYAAFLSAVYLGYRSLKSVLYGHSFDSDIPVVADTITTMVAVANSSVPAHLRFERWVQDAGGLVVLKLPGEDSLLTSDPKACLYALRHRPELFSRAYLARTATSIAAPSLPTPLFGAEGEEWRLHRGIFSPSFTPRATEHMSRKILEHIAEMEKEIKHLVTTSSSRAVDIDVAALCSRYTFGVVLKAVFGYESLDEVLSAPEYADNNESLVSDMKSVLELVANRLFVPALIYKWFPSKRDLELNAAQDRLLSLIRGRVKSAVAEWHGSSDSADFWSVMINAIKTGQMTEAEVESNVLGFFVAGYDTTANTATWLAYLLAKHPSVAQRVCEEVDQLLDGKYTSVADISAKQLRGLKYVDAVVKEALRLKTPAPLVGLTAEQNVHLPMSNGRSVLVPKGCGVYCMLRLASIGQFGMNFDPDRWLSEPSKTKLNETFMAFGGGTRICPGINVANLELRAFCVVFSRFQLSRISFDNSTPRMNIERSADNPNEDNRFVMAPENITIRFGRE